MNPLIHVYPPGHGRRMMLLEFVQNARHRILDTDLVGEGELDELTGALRRLLPEGETRVKVCERGLRKPSRQQAL